MFAENSTSQVLPKETRTIFLIIPRSSGIKLPSDASHVDDHEYELGELDRMKLLTEHTLQYIKTKNYL